MLRRFAFALALGAIAISACSDRSESPAEPSALKQPALPVCSTQAWLTDIKSRNGLVFSGSLLTSANDKVTAIYTQCKAGAKADAQKKAIFFIDWMFKKYRARLTKPTARAVDLANLTSATLSGVGLQTKGISPATFGPTGGAGSYDPVQSTPTTVTTINQNAGVQLPGTPAGGVPAYSEPTLITLIQLPDSPQLTGEGAPPANQQFPPNYDINAINASGTHEFQAGAADGVVSICFRPDIDYPAEVVIGHTTFAGVFEFLPPTVPIAQVTCGAPIPSIGAALPPGLHGLALSAWQAAVRYVGPMAEAILLPQPLGAAVRTGVASGSTRSLSPFGLVEASDAPGEESASVSAGEAHSCGVTAGGVAYCWGDNPTGALGDGTTSSSDVPVAVAGDLRFASISAGYSHTCGVTSGGVAYCWGDNQVGALGDATTTSSNVPVAVAGGLTFASVSAGFLHSCGVTTSGAAYCWGYGAFGQLGTGANASSAQPLLVSGELTFASVSTNRYRSCGVTTGGAGYCWGDNSAGQIGDGTTTGRMVPALVLGGLTFASISAGDAHTCGATTPQSPEAGAAFCWGAGSFGQLGNGVTTDNGVANPLPVRVAGGLAFASVAAGSTHSCGVTAAGAAYCWGGGGSGQLGDGTFTFISNVPGAVSGSHSFGSASSSRNHACAVTSGVTYCWGANLKGQLGNGTTSNSNVPVIVSSP
jgi:alpha-tubulin suppressor-like RCC1 family protein